MDYQATAKYIRMSPRKVRLVADSIRRLTPKTALFKLKEQGKLAAKSLLAVIESAVANAHQKNANDENLSFKMIEVMEGPSMKRWHAISRGQAHSYKKRMTHIKIVLTDESIKTTKQKIHGGEQVSIS